MPRIGINDFVKRQTKGSPFSHFEPNVADAWGTLVALTDANFDKATPGYKPGILLVPVPAAGFFSGVVNVVASTPLHAAFRARRPGEDPYLFVTAPVSAKLPAQAVEIVLYRHDVLGEDSACTDADWEIISINARASLEPEPMTPLAMARNMLNLPGGTPAQYTAEEFAQAIVYWSTRVMADPGL